MLTKEEKREFAWKRFVEDNPRLFIGNDPFSKYLWEEAYDIGQAHSYIETSEVVQGSIDADKLAVDTVEGTPTLHTASDLATLLNGVPATYSVNYQPVYRFDATSYPMQTLAEYQDDIRLWTAYNFPNSNDDDPALGLVEELGELAHSILKLKQHIRGDATKHIIAERDAIGDFVIYLLDYCNKRGLDATALMRSAMQITGIDNGIASWQQFINSRLVAMVLDDGTIVKLTDSRTTFMFVSSALGRLSEARVKLHVGDHTSQLERDSVGNMLIGVMVYCAYSRYQLAEILDDTWPQVRARDWRKYPETGRPPVTGDTIASDVITVSKQAYVPTPLPDDGTTITPEILNNVRRRVEQTSRDIANRALEYIPGDSERFKRSIEG